MKIALRADAGKKQGTGHVMRCLTLAEAFNARGHTTTLIGHIGDIPWLWETLRMSSVDFIECAQDSLDRKAIVAGEFDGVVVDSYRIPPASISRLNEQVPCLAIIDGNARGVIASLYVDQNIGAVMNGVPPGSENRWLGGSEYALVREAVLRHRNHPLDQQRQEIKSLVAFMGGTDPSGAIVAIANSILAEPPHLDVTLVSPPAWIPQIETIAIAHPKTRIIEPSSDLPRILGGASIVVSAAGTSAWDICTMARPSVLVGVVDNQRAALSSIEREGLALVVDATDDTTTLSEVGPLVSSLINSPKLRQNLMERCFSVFDGRGKFRVVEAAEQVWL